MSRSRYGEVAGRVYGPRSVWAVRGHVTSEVAIAAVRAYLNDGARGKARIGADRMICAGHTVGRWAVDEKRGRRCLLTGYEPGPGAMALTIVEVLP